MVQDALGALFGAGFGLFFFLIAIASFVGWIWALANILTSDLGSDKKLLWALVVLFGGIVGALLYYFLEYRE